MALRMILNRRKQEQTRARLAAVGKKEVQGLAVVGQVAHPEVGQSAGGGAAHIGDGDQVQAAGGLDHCYGDRVFCR